MQPSLTRLFKHSICLKLDNFESAQIIPPNLYKQKLPKFRTSEFQKPDFFWLLLAIIFKLGWADTHAVTIINYYSYLDNYAVCKQPKKIVMRQVTSPDLSHLTCVYTDIKDYGICTISTLIFVL